MPWGCDDAWQMMDSSRWRSLLVLSACIVSGHLHEHTRRSRGGMAQTKRSGMVEEDDFAKRCQGTLGSWCSEFLNQPLVPWQVTIPQLQMRSSVITEVYLDPGLKSGILVLQSSSLGSCAVASEPPFTLWPMRRSCVLLCWERHHLVRHTVVEFPIDRSYCMHCETFYSYCSSLSAVLPRCSNFDCLLGVLTWSTLLPGPATCKFDFQVWSKLTENDVWDPALRLTGHSNWLHMS